MTLMGLTVSNPPGVDGWPMNKYRKADTTDYWLGFVNIYANAINEVVRRLEGYEDPFDGSTYSYLDLLPNPNATSEQLVDHLIRTLGIKPTASERQEYITFTDTRWRSSGIQEDIFDPTSSNDARRKVASLLWLMSQHQTYMTY